MAFLEVKELQKSFGSLHVLKSVNFCLERGEVMSIIGSSGNGKTTLLRCLNLLEYPDGGTVDINGENFFDSTVKYSEKTIAEKQLNLGLVFQNFNLFPQYTALGNVVLALNVHSENKLKRERVGYFARKKQMATIKQENSEVAKEILEKVGLGDKLDYYPCQLSGGQQQRVAIARALALKPTILCFDEPTSALDPELTGEVLRVIKELKSPEIAMIIVTHEMQFAKDISDKILFMADGRVEEFGTPEYIFNQSNNEHLKAFLSGYSKN